MNHATLVEVLRPQPPVSISVHKPTPLVRGSLADNLVDSAAAKVRDLYIRGQRRPSYDPARPESFWDACVDTSLTYYELTDAIADDKMLGVLTAIFDRAGFISANLRPTTLEAQVDIQLAAVSAAKTVSLFMAQQQSFAGLEA